MPDELELTPEDDAALNAACDEMAKTPYGKKLIADAKARCEERKKAERAGQDAEAQRMGEKQVVDA